jgi:TrmH family RNA methyltransferase
VARARRLLKRGFRESDGLFLAEGPQACREAAIAGKLKELFLTQEAFDRYTEIVKVVADAGAEIIVCTEAVIEQFSSTVSPQGMTAIVRMWDQDPAKLFTDETKLVVALTAVRDPGNAGSVIRVADAAGAQGVVMSNDSVDLFNPKVVRASVGSIFHLPISIGQELTDTIASAREVGMQVLAADANGVSLYGGVQVHESAKFIKESGTLEWRRRHRLKNAPITLVITRMIEVDSHGHRLMKCSFDAQNEITLERREATSWYILIK